MKQWDIFTYNFPDAGSHPAVIVSHPERVASKNMVNVLVCSSQRASRPPKPHEIMLDTADGLDWETLCRCDLLYSVEKSGLTTQRGAITPARQKQIVQKIIASLGWQLY